MKKRILIVEDDQALARVLADNLRFSGTMSLTSMMALKS